MNRDDIIKLARKAGLSITTAYGEKPALQRFAELVAAVEREACAKLCDEIAIDMWNLYKGRPPYKGNEEGRASDFTQGRSAGADDCAEAIRKRRDT